MVDAVVAAYGRLDVAVNNAAITPDVAPLAEFDEDYWDRLMGVNLKGVALSLKFELRQLIEQGGGGSIVNVSSIRGFSAQPNAAAYVAAKHGVVGLTKVAAMENGARNIRVNCVAPGAISTPMLAASMARRGQTEADIAPAMSLLNRTWHPRRGRPGITLAGFRFVFLCHWKHHPPRCRLHRPLINTPSAFPPAPGVTHDHHDDRQFRALTPAAGRPSLP